MPSALIADDEPLLLAELRDLLAEAWPELRVVAEASNGPQALRLVHEHAPDVAFLDIEMPRMSGLEVAAAAPDCRIVFVTAYERHAVDAFEHGATDYLLKPLTPSRLAIAVHRLRGLLQASLPQPLQFVQAWSGETMRIVPVDEVIALISEDKYTRVVTERGDLLLRRSLVDLRTELDESVFWTVARGAVIHARHIERVERAEGRELQVRMWSMARAIVVGRAWRDRFRGM